MNTVFDLMDELDLKPLEDPNESPIVTQEAIKNIEGEFGYSLPTLYVQFLLRYGLSAFDGNWVYFKAPDNWDDITDHAMSDVRAFYGLNTEREADIWDSRIALKRSLAGRLPSYFFPICESDGLSTVVYISCRQSDYGHIYALTRKQIWNVVDGESSTQEAGERAFHLATSFQEFLEGLHREQSEDDTDVGPFYAAVLAGNRAFLQNIIDEGRMETYRSEFGSNLLESAIMSEVTWPVEFLLQYIKPSPRDLSLAIQYGHLEAIPLLLSQGVDINARIPENTTSSEWQTPLIQAVCSDMYDKKYAMAQLLVEAGADVDMRDSQGKVALDYVRPNNRRMPGILAKSRK